MIFFVLAYHIYSSVNMFADSFCRFSLQHTLSRVTGDDDDTVSYRSQVVYYISVAFLRQYYKGATRREVNIMSQCPFSTDKELEASHLLSLGALAVANQQVPAGSVLTTDQIRDTPVATFVSYVDFSSDRTRDARHTTLSMDVSTCLGPNLTL
jgi:hypothetical protein